MKLLIPSTLILLFSVFSFSANMGTLNEINKPKTLSVKGDKLIITEEESIYIYSLETLKLTKKFGKEGEGPGEFKMGHGVVSLNIDISDNNIIVNSSTKITWFSMEGEYIREKKVPPMKYLIPMNYGYAGNCLINAGKKFPVQSVCLFDKNFKKVETLMTSDVPVGMGAKRMMPPYNFKYLVHNNKIYLSAGKDKILIKVFDQKGKELNNIKLSADSLPVSSKYKNMVRTFYKTDPAFKNFWPRMKDRLYFPEYFPGLKDLFVDKNRIYIQTWNKKGGNLEWILLDKTGKELKRIFLPQGKESAIVYSPYTIANGKYYYLKEDIDEEVWGLFVMDLDKK
ncbi:MAG: hypothetical protein ABFR75_02775 [Acidobacteriota bacterium]